jgi:uncharacterized damage-inducible protein DinB
MRDLLPDLFAHQAWADALHWKTLEGLAGTLDDGIIRERLHHIHLVQRAFLTIWRSEPLALKEAHDYESMAALKDDARRYHDEVAAFLASASPERLAETVEIPWFQDPPCRITLSQAMHQVVMHSHYHRAQNATRMRELGLEPPVTDLIVWQWKGRPAPEWP